MKLDIADTVAGQNDHTNVVCHFFPPKSWIYFFFHKSLKNYLITVESKLSFKNFYKKSIPNSLKKWQNNFFCLKTN